LIAVLFIKYSKRQNLWQCGLVELVFAVLIATELHQFLKGEIRLERFEIGHSPINIGVCLEQLPPGKPLCFMLVH